jgi:type VI secretion system protein ImpA
MFDLDPWLHPLEGPNPSGAELRNDQRFHDIERLTRPRIEVTRDERNNPIAQTAIPVDWAEVLRRAEELRGSGRDLRLLVIVVRALAHTRGLGGLADGLALIARTLEAHWDTMHPGLRPAANPREGALRRINALLQLQNVEDGLLGDMRGMVFLSPRGFGSLTGRDIERGTLDARAVLAEAASGLSAAERDRLVAEHDALVTRVRVGCMAEADQHGEEYARLLADARAAAAALDAVEAALNARLGDALAVTLPDLKRFLARFVATLARSEAAGGGDAAAAAEASVVEGAPAMPIVAAAPPAVAAAGLPDRISTREEVVKCVDLIIGFYDRTEPSSPIPHLARRIRRMVPMDFMELMEDLAPSGLKEFRLLAGVPDNKGKAAKDER